MTPEQALLKMLKMIDDERDLESVIQILSDSFEDGHKVTDVSVYETCEEYLEL